MEQQIINFLKTKNNSYVDIEDEKSIKKIYELLINNIIYEPINVIENHYLGWYCCNINKNYDLMKKCFIIGIDNGNIHSMNNLGLYYSNTEQNYDLMKKYYLMATDLGNITSMNNLGYYYQYIEKNYDLMKKYYLMAINKNYVISMTNLGNYYKNIEQNYDLMKKYYLMAIDNNNITAIYNLANYYQTIEKNYDLMKKYCLIGINNDDINSLNKLINYYNINNLLIEKLEFFIEYIDKIERTQIIDTINEISKIQLNEQDEKKFIDIIINFEFEDTDKVFYIVKILVKTIKYKISITKLHFEYSLEGKGYESAKEDFYGKII
jgi:TPR repeat protein